MLPFGFKLESLTTLTWITSPLIGPTVSMVTLVRSFFLTCQLQEANLFALLPLRMLISCMTSLLEGPVQESCIFSIRLLWNGSEFVAARIATEQIMDLQYTLRMMGVPLDGKAYMFGDNQSLITSGTIPHSSLNKRQP